LKSRSSVLAPFNCRNLQEQEQQQDQRVCNCSA
jgi:hypothetical protein